VTERNNMTGTIMFLFFILPLFKIPSQLSSFY
jgi:hypothetical protein